MQVNTNKISTLMIIIADFKFQIKTSYAMTNLLQASVMKQSRKFRNKGISIIKRVLLGKYNILFGKSN